MVYYYIEGALTASHYMSTTPPCLAPNIHPYIHHHHSVTHLQHVVLHVLSLCLEHELFGYRGLALLFLLVVFLFLIIFIDIILFILL